jgi:aspartyl/glutamyl-tRNA(Asn/Gln) amidotransferase C subunit
MSDQSISLEETRDIAYLARLAFNDEELVRYSRDLERIVALFQSLEEANLAMLSPNSSHHVQTEKTLRADVMSEGSVTEGDPELVKQAFPHFNQESRQFEVPLVIDAEESS